MQSVREIEQSICAVIFQISGVHIRDRKMNLLSPDAGIRPADLLYIFDLFERDMGAAPAALLEDADFTEMTVEKLAQKIWTMTREKGARC